MTAFAPHHHGVRVATVILGAFEVTIGASALSRVLFVVHTEGMRGGRVRIISARKASSAQRRRYEEG